MTDSHELPDKIETIKKRGYVVWSQDGLPADLVARFDKGKIPVVGVRHVRVWGIQVDDERELPGHERTAIPDEELWEINLRAKDGSHYEVSSDYVEPAPD